jgi:hypothetical protein
MARWSTASVRDKEGASGMVAVNGERRSIAKLIRFTPSELERVVDQAQASGRPVACFIREASLGSRPRMKNGTVGDTVIHHLARLGTRLRALACTAKEQNLPAAAEFDAALAELLDTIRQID